jgi:hypothetical protein
LEARRVLLMAMMTTTLTTASRAYAYRPFDSTDASVATTGDLEFELGPVGYHRARERNFLVAPSLIINYGFASRWEMVLQGRDFILLDDVPGEPRVRLVDTGFFLKGVLREGSLQGRDGPSVGTELGVLLPTVNGEPGVGATGIVIVSQRWEAATLHVNGAVSLTRAGNADFFGGVILEGPHAWAVRPVAEVFVDHEVTADTALSGLVGAIWRANESLSFDAAVRVAAVAGSPVYEARLGLTWAVPVVRSP